MDADVRFARWQDISPSQKAAVEQLAIDKQQVQYAGPTDRAVAASASDVSGDVQGLVIFHRDIVVGLLLLKRRGSLPEWAVRRAAVVSALRIDQRFQGQGIGTTALKLLPIWLSREWPEITCIMLSVDEANLQGRRVYEKAGWVDRGMRVEGRIGWVRFMRFDLTASRRFGR